MRFDKGTTPPGAQSESEAALWVRDMFGNIAHRYDRANHWLSWNMDRAWRRRTVQRVALAVQQPNARVLDLCCGTGDLTLALARQQGSAVMGSDFSHPMLLEAQEKSRDAVRLFEADALRLPLANESLDVLTCAFGFRNLANYEGGLREFRRALKRDGTLAILEFSQPADPLFGALYNLYSRWILPRVGSILTGVPKAYTYLPDSVRKFPGPEELAEMLRRCGFSRVTWERMTGGIVALHLAVRGES